MIPPYFNMLACYPHHLSHSTLHVAVDGHGIVSHLHQTVLSISCLCYGWIVKLSGEKNIQAIPKSLAHLQPCSSALHSDKNQSGVRGIAVQDLTKG